MNFTNKTKIFYIFSLTFLLLFIPCQFLLADTDYSDTGDVVGDGFGLGETAAETKLPQLTVPQFLGQVAGAGLALAGSAFLFLIIYGGIIIMTAAGAKDKVDKGKNIIVWAIIGALILFSAYAITNLIFGLFTNTNSI